MNTHCQRDGRQHLLGQIQGGLAHLAAQARGTDAASFAGEGHQVLKRAPPYGEVCDTDCQPDPPRAKSNVDDEMCNESRGPCFDDFGADLKPTLNSEWQFFWYPWSSLKPVNWSFKNLSSIVTKQIYGVRFQTAPGQVFDLWIDDVSFICQ